ncbi:MAG: lysylphosphatidylglycerol synthase transmembrane domain-containing protein [Actinomycetes bacterium]
MQLNARRMVRGFRVFSSAADAGRVRRPTDIVLLGLALFGIAVLTVMAPGPSAFDTALTSVIQSLRVFGGWMWQIGYALLAIWVLVLLLLTLIRRVRLLVDYLVAAAIALGLALLTGWAAGTPVSESMRSLVSADPPAVYVAVRVAVTTAVIVAASPHLARPFRYIGRAVVLIGAISAVVLGSSLPIGAAAGLAVGVAAAAITHLIFGSPGGRPISANVDVALADLGIEAHDVAEANVELSGVAMFTARDSADQPLLVKVYGRDAWDGQLITSTWTALQNKGQTPRIRAGRTERVDHEAVATLMAERAGVSVLPLVAVGRSSDGDALLVTRLSGTFLTDVPHDQITDDVLQESWRLVVALQALGISHGDIDAAHIVVRDEGTVALADLGAASMGAGRSALMVDRARLLVTLAIATDAERSVAAAAAVIGQDGLAEVLPLLQPAVLDRPTRKQVDDGEWSLDDLRTAAVAAAGVEAPELIQLRRVTLKSVLLTVLIAVFAYWLITQLAGVDFQSIWAELASADWAWLIAALLLSPFVQVAYSFSTMGASIVPLRYWPVLMLQYSIQFIALVLPSTAARLALEIRFFEKFGIAGGAAVSIGMLDSFSGFVVQIALLILITISGLPGFTSSLTGSTTSSTDSTSTTDTSSSPNVLALAIALIVLGAILTLVIPKFRNRVRTAIPRWREAAKKHAEAAREVLTVLRHPAKVGQMLVGNLGSQVIQAIILGLCLKAFGYEAALSQLILINTAVSLFAGLMPVPGGMGVAEAGFTAGLQAIGIPSTVAISTAIAMRLVTFYLPPIWGSAAMRWLRKSDYL